MLSGPAAVLAGTCRALSSLQRASCTSQGPWDLPPFGNGAHESSVVSLEVHLHPPEFAKLGHRARPHLPPRSFHRRAGLTLRRSHK